MTDSRIKKIMFISGIDFKQKSIQVIRKTPEAFRDSGWEVTYVVARDTAVGGNYEYEEVITPPGMEVIRLEWPLARLRTSSRKWVRRIATKVSVLLVVLSMASVSRKIAKVRDFDVIYGYEIHGVLAARLVMVGMNRTKLITRFQGSFIAEMIKNCQFLRLVYNLDALIALRVHANLTIMTDDGTQGDYAFKNIVQKKKSRPFRFWVNGVDDWEAQPYRALTVNSKVKIISVSRLVSWKRVDRVLDVLHRLNETSCLEFECVIVGGGVERRQLEELAGYYQLDERVRFTGALEHETAMVELESADIFLSLYESSNVGNPLLEAIRRKRFIFTLANGDTSRWIQHRVNGFIYDEVDGFADLIAMDIQGLVASQKLQSSIQFGVSQLCDDRLWNWEARLKSEVDTISELL